MAQPWHSISLACVSIIFACCSFYFYRDSQLFLTVATETEGTVIELKENKNGLFTPVIAYIDNTENKRFFRPSFASKPPRYSIGQKLTILFVPHSPENIKIKDYDSLWSNSVDFGFFSILSMSLSILLWLYRFEFYALAGYPELAGPNKSLNTAPQSGARTGRLRRPAG